MYLREILKKAKNGDEKSIDMLAKYYEQNFINNVKKKYENVDEEEIKKEFPNIIRKYFEKDYKRHISKYLYEEIALFQPEKQSLVRNKELNLKEEYEKYLYLKENLFEKYKDKTCLSDEELKLLIDIKYEEFLIIYLKGNSNYKVSKNLNTRLIVYFNKCMLLTKEDIKLISITYYDYNNLLNNFIKKLKGISPNNVREVILEKTYIELIYRYFMMKKKYDIESYINKNLRKKLNDLLRGEKETLNITYVDEENIICEEKRINGLKKEYKKRII